MDSFTGILPGAPTKQAAVRAIGVTKRYGLGSTVVTALDDVTVALPVGDFTAVMGPSGSGKSTLLHCLAGLESVDSGTIYVGETRLAALSERALTTLRRDRIGFVFQSFNLLPTLTAGENLLLPLRLASRPPDPAWLDLVIDAVGLRDRLERRPNELSGGEQQRLAIARGLVGRPDVIFADEPTGNLDSRSSGRVLDLLARCARELGQTVVMVTHDPTAAGYASRVLRVADGRIVDEQTDLTLDRGNPGDSGPAHLTRSGVRRRGGAVLWLSARELAGHPRRAVLSGLAAVIGVALISGTLVLGDTANRTQPADPDVTQLKDILLLAGCVSLLVGAFVISTTISAVLAQRSQELALLRCLGAHVRQLRRMIRWEALLIGMLASLAGLLGGIAVAAGLRAYVNSRLSAGDAALPGHALVVSPRTVIISVAAGVGVTLFCALTPARRASRMSPLAALRNLPARRRDRTGRVRLAIGITLTTVGVGSVPFAVVGGPGYLLLPGAALTLAGVRIAGPAAASPLAKVAGAPLSWLFGQPGVLARRNAVRGPERTAGAAGAVMIGLALVGFLATLLASTRAFLDAEVDRVADITVLAGATTDGGKGASAPLSPDLVSRLTALSTLAAVVPVRSSEATVAGSRDSVIGTDLAAYNGVRGLQVTAGSLADLSPGGLWVIDDVARERGWSIGTPVEVALSGGTRSLTVRAIYRHESYVSSSLPRYVMASQDFDQLRGTPEIAAVLARVRDGIAIADARTEIDREVAVVQGISVEDKAQIRRDTVGQVSRAGALLLALAGLASLVGLFGILNAMALAVVDRVREFGLLRAVGMQGRQIRTVVLGEAVIIAVVGAAIGLGIGILFGWAAARVFEHSSAPARFTVPMAWLTLVAIVAISAAVLAAALPARSASRVETLRAIASE